MPDFDIEYKRKNVEDCIPVSVNLIAFFIQGCSGEAIPISFTGVVFVVAKVTFTF
jgi:hypothetical protein